MGHVLGIRLATVFVAATLLGLGGCHDRNASALENAVAGTVHIWDYHYGLGFQKVSNGGPGADLVCYDPNPRAGRCGGISGSGFLKAPDSEKYCTVAVFIRNSHVDGSGTFTLGLRAVQTEATFQGFDNHTNPSNTDLSFRVHLRTVAKSNVDASCMTDGIVVGCGKGWNDEGNCHEKQKGGVQ